MVPFIMIKNLSRTTGHLETRGRTNYFKDSIFTSPGSRWIGRYLCRDSTLVILKIIVLRCQHNFQRSPDWSQQWKHSLNFVLSSSLFFLFDVCNFGGVFVYEKIQTSSFRFYEYSKHRDSCKCIIERSNFKERICLLGESQEAATQAFSSDEPKIANSFQVLYVRVKQWTLFGKNEKSVLRTHLAQL